MNGSSSSVARRKATYRNTLNGDSSMGGQEREFKTGEERKREAPEKGKESPAAGSNVDAFFDPHQQSANAHEGEGVRYSERKRRRGESKKR